MPKTAAPKKFKDVPFSSRHTPSTAKIPMTEDRMTGGTNPAIPPYTSISNIDITAVKRCGSPRYLPIRYRNPKSKAI